MVVLDKTCRQTEFLELVFSVGLHEEAPAVLKNLRDEYGNALEWLRFDFYFHRSFARPQQWFLRCRFYTCGIRVPIAIESFGSSPFSTRRSTSTLQFHSIAARYNSNLFFRVSVGLIICKTP